MDLDLYVAEFERSIGNIPEVLARWPEFSPSLRSHLADELTMMLLRQREAADVARVEGRAAWLAMRLAELNGELLTLFAKPLAKATGVRVQELLAPNTSTLPVEDGEGPGVSVPPSRAAAMEEPFAVAA